MDKILMIIPVINLWDEYTIHAMESIASSVCDVPFDVLIVDQASTDMTISKAEDFGNRKMQGRVHIIKNKENTGCGGGWNQGVDFALENGYTHMIIANNDVLFGPGMIQALYNRMKRDPKVLLCSAVDVIKELPAPQIVLNGDNDVNKKPDTEAPHPNFSCFMITPETIEKVGYFEQNEFYPAYWEDNSYHYRIKILAGEDKAIANTTAVFIHYGSRTQNQSLGAPVVPGPMFEKNRSMYVELWGGLPGQEKFINPRNDKTKSARMNEKMQYDIIG